MLQIMKFIAKSKTRPLKLLIALTEKIGEKPELLDLKNCSDVMYCLSIFSLKNKVSLALKMII